MILAREEPHGPELEAASEPDNVRFFSRDSTAALAAVLVDTAADREYWRSRRDEISAPVADRYCVETMVESFMGGLGLEPRSSDQAVTRVTVP